MPEHREIQNDSTEEETEPVDPVDVALEIAHETALDDDVDDRIVELIRECQQYRAGAGDLE